MSYTRLHGGSRGSSVRTVMAKLLDFKFVFKLLAMTLWSGTNSKSFQSIRT